MSEDHPIVPQTHALLRPNVEITDALIEAARSAVVLGEITIREFASVHGIDAGRQLARAMGDTIR